MRNEIILKVYRFDPTSGKPPTYKRYSVPITERETVLDALLYVKEHQDATLSLRFSCRMAVCGSCGMLIDGLPRLACYTQISELDTDEIEVRPMSNYPIVRDLVVDMSGFFEKHRSVMPWLIRRDVREQNQPTKQYLQSDEQLLEYLQFSYCIKCGLCYAACPVVTAMDEFLGPQALAQLYRYIRDSRDEGATERLKSAGEFNGVWRCHFAGSCSQVCPKGVDPALAIQLLRRRTLFMK
ncbi:MAG: succinate dehydrogenase iron-sulfur subunit [Aigarchaeota archaeon]|nr:succinate dehydrogenase iron-sulfur subunit [Aigarchaeota archaeon]MDW8092195.1 succinate dehydrogenase iron-sulfur subunit [Nitrososphaerota archaeon]